MSIIQLHRWFKTQPLDGFWVYLNVPQGLDNTRFNLSSTSSLPWFAENNCTAGDFFAAMRQEAFLVKPDVPEMSSTIKRHRWC